MWRCLHSDRLRLGTIGRACASVEQMVNEMLPKVAKLALSTMDKRHKFLVEESNFLKVASWFRRALSNVLTSQV
ncbi:glycine radical enzyme, YjjI family [Mannheimia haemolytica]|uniref:Glycine radical enzyme, YjjI family n=1 Tax=Mannheimia haemolytica TaxID=75985 RepID=A0A378MTA1_MANHA|nr:glycine radical enzyme, YjjI family [Mannheimia haemolytica]